MDKGAAILDYGEEFGKFAGEKAMKNDGGDFSDNNLSANKVTSYGEKSATSMGPVGRGHQPEAWDGIGYGSPLNLHSKGGKGYSEIKDNSTEGGEGEE